MGPADVLQMAILGVLAREPVVIEDLISITQSLGGSFWHPTVDVISASLTALEARRFIKIESVAVPVSETIVRQLHEGGVHFQFLMERDTSAMPEPLFHCLVGIKIAFLDILSPLDRGRQIDSLIGRLNNTRNTLRGAIGRYSHRQGQFGNSLAFEDSRLETEIRWLNDLREPGPSRVGLQN